MMHLSACWMWLISSVWRFSLAKLISTFLFSPVSILCFLWWLTFHFSINAITCFNFSQQEYLSPKLVTKSPFVITELTFICFFHSRSDIPFWFASWTEDFSQLACDSHENAGPWNHLMVLEKILNVIPLEASSTGLSSDGM